MVEYIKSKKGYFYKLLKNGEKKRISQEEYNKKNNKMIGGYYLFKKPNRQIKDGDIMYKDDLVCILKPNVKKGIVIYTHYTQPNNMNSLCISGLKTGKQLKSEGVKFGRTR